MGATVKLRRSDQYRAFVTDQGNLIIDADFGIVHDPEKLAGELSMVTGLVEHGLFTRVSEVHVARIGTEGLSVEILER
jgi:ribose 5-phosphate isomerase A